MSVPTSTMPESPANDALFRLIADVEFGHGVIVQPLGNSDLVFSATLPTHCPPGLAPPVF